MTEEITGQLQALIFESSNFNSNDILVHIPEGSDKVSELERFVDISIDCIHPKILKSAKSTFKETGLNPLCVTNFLVQLDYKESVIRTPLFLYPAEVIHNKLNHTISIYFEENDGFVNPFIQSYFKQKEIELSTSFEVIIQQLEQLEIVPQPYQAVGNFHHHRYGIIKELEELQDQPSLVDANLSLLGFTRAHAQLHLPLTSRELFASDADHLEVFNTFEYEDLVIQGPPGTGKSQSLCNLIAKLLFEKQRVLAVSEKRAALEVIQAKLAQFNLDKLGFISSSSTLSKEFISSLKSTWNFFEHEEIPVIRNLELSHNYKANLDLTLRLLREPELVGGLSLSAFLEAVAPYNLDAATYTSCDITLPELEKYSPLVNHIYSDQLNHLIPLLKPRIFFRDGLLNFDAKIHHWTKQLEIIQSNTSVNTWNDLHDLMRKSARLQVLNNELIKKYNGIFKPNSRKQKKFLSLRKKQQKLLKKLDVLSIQLDGLDQFTLQDLQLAKATMETGNFFQKRKAKKQWLNDGYSIEEMVLSKLPVFEEKHQVEVSLSQIDVDFCELDIEDMAKEVEIIYSTLHQFTPEEWQDIFNEQLNSETKNLIDLQLLISTLHGDLKSYFSLGPDHNIARTLNQTLDSLPFLIEHQSELDQLPLSLLRLIGECASYENLYTRICKGHHVRFSEQYPKLSSFKLEDVQNKIDLVLNEKEHEYAHFSQEILAQIKEKFDAFHSLLNTPAQKLSPEQKDLKKELRKGKSILVKEFGKSRSHPSIRELYNSPAKHWIQLLKPLWLSSPLELSNSFPMEQALFDVCIFDEASQIPLQNGLGAIQRSKRIIVAGDEHQMGPSRYFTSGTNEITDLLHQASYHWTSIRLTHHYRSLHEDLIAFSNKHFYDNELKVFPGTTLEHPVKSHYIADGKFIDRRNTIEAKAVAEHITKALSSGSNFGVVAFSEEQLQCILGELDAATKQQLFEVVDNEQAFIKTLENVQGDECDELIISFGYAKNEAYEFHMRFGPVNLSTGRNRLNVLFTRARKQLHFYHSVQSSDFKLSDNESVNLLHKWFEFVEALSSKALPPNIGDNITLNFENKTISIAHVASNFKLVEELITFHSVMKQRGWKINYI